MKINLLFPKTFLLIGILFAGVKVATAGNADVSLKFGNGLTISDKDSSMSFNFGLMMQGRVDVYKAFDKSSKPITTAQAKRIRLKFKGYFLNQKLNYFVQLSLSPTDVKAGNAFLDGYVKYSPVKQFAIQFGQAKLPGDREEIALDERQFFVDRSTSNALFRLERDFGIQLFGNFGKKFIFKPTISIASGEGKNYTAADIQHLDYTVRFDFLPTGEFADRGDYTMQDLARESKPKVAFGVAYDFNNKPTLQKAQNGGNFIPDSSRKNLHTIYTDAILKYKGFTTTAGYIYRKADNNKLYLSGQSLYATASYVFKKKVEIGARVNHSFSGKIGNIPTVNEYTMGLAYYVYKNAFKLETDYTILQNKTMHTLAGLWRFQMQWAF
ncbi:MAG TPA: porin [Chitinophagales bacterium]|nr:porin [Chitinophagales bacterium]HNM32397.1 porin [Chitinophagales bacterium]